MTAAPRRRQRHTLCPKCGAPGFRVSDSRDETEEGRRRRRKCDVCQHRQTTFELDAEVVKAIFAARAALKVANTKVSAALALLEGLEIPETGDQECQVPSQTTDE